MNIQLIDDEEAILKTLKRVLERRGHSCSTFSSVTKALELYRKNPFDVVFVDYRMPEKSGIEVLAQLKTYDPAAKVIIMTGNADLQTAIDAVNFGAMAFLRKPIDLKLLQNFLDEAEKLKQTKAEGQLFDKKLTSLEKLANIGLSTSAMMHDFKNIITMIRLYTDLIVEDIPGSSPTHEHLEKIISACNMATDCCAMALAYTKKDCSGGAFAKLNEIVEKTTKLLRFQILSSIEIRKELSSEADFLVMEHTLISQILMNLCLNASHAINDAGTIQIKTKKETNPAHLKEGVYAVLEVEDNGSGMNEKLQESIFTPFFSTKKEGEGTGLGLYIVSQIVKKMEGKIFIKSHLGKGSLFSVYLPVLDNKISGGADVE